MALVKGFCVWPEKGMSNFGGGVAVCRGELAGVSFTVALFQKGEDGLIPALLSADAKSPLPRTKREFGAVFAKALAGRFGSDGAAHELDGSHEAVAALVSQVG